MVAVGLDISDYSIEMLALNAERHVLAYERRVLAEGIIINGTIQKKEILKDIVSALLALVQKFRTRNTQFSLAVNVPESRIFLHTLEADARLAGTELEEYLRDEAAKIVPLEKSDLIGSFAIVQSSSAANRILYAVTNKDCIREIQGLFEELGVPAPILDLETAALARALLPPGPLAKAAALVDGGAEITAISIIETPPLAVFSAIHPEGGSHLTHAIKDALHISFEEAEKMKHAFGLSRDTAKKADASVVDSVSSLTRAHVERILQSIEEAVRMHEAGEIIIAGGLALLPGVIPFASGYLKRLVTPGNPLRNIMQSEVLGKERPSLLYATVIGLALRALGYGDAAIDMAHTPMLTRQHESAAQKSVPWKQILFITAAAALFATAAYMLFSAWRAHTAADYMYEQNTYPQE